ncbi:Conserved_hypothetical protein [Hexamita inflata]|uniref:Uncharacterized protein n=1 Tax=Hexamita inflata TaxID=28002 RepID=A0AA86PDE2_9EUKA|nr:Conserved hypothetical protein [Hexamita inflata]
MIEQYKYKTQYQTLQIVDNQELKSLEFIQNLDIDHLVLIQCKNVIPILDSKTIKTLNIEFCNIKSIEKIDLENLEVLIIQEHKIQLFDDFIEKNIIKFKKLKQLSIYKQDVVDTKQISQIFELNTLKLEYCGLKNVEALIQLINLTELSLCGNDQINITPLQFLNLTKLNLGFCNLLRIDQLIPIVNLIQLSVNNNTQIDISPLKYLKRLTKLNLSTCCLTNVQVLQNLRNLENLDLQNNNYIDFAPLQHLTKLIVLNISNCGLNNLDFTRQLTKLQQLYVQNNFIVYISSIQKLQYLSQLEADNNRLIDIQTIQSLPNFNSFKLDNQSKPDKKLKQVACRLRAIYSPMFELRVIKNKNISIQRKQMIATQKINRYSRQLFNKQVMFVQQVVSLFQTLNSFSSYE